MRIKEGEENGRRRERMPSWAHKIGDTNCRKAIRRGLETSFHLGPVPIIRRQGRGHAGEQKRNIFRGSTTPSTLERGGS